LIKVGSGGISRKLQGGAMKIKQSDRVGYGVAEKFPLSSCVPFVASVLFASGASAGQGDCSNLTALQIPDTTITSAEYVAAANGLPGYCDLRATVAPQTDVEVRLPDDWSGRYLHFGGGGFDGRIPNLNSAAMSSGNPLSNHFVVVGSNGGHRAISYPGASFSTDKTLTLDYASGALQEADLVGNAAVLAYYRQPPKYRYFDGCSNGGKNASVVMAVLGDNYDGVVAGDGVYGHSNENTGGSDMSGMTAAWARAQQQVPLSAAKGALVYRAELAACDALDGIADGIVSNPEACHFNPEVLLCAGSSNDSCLTAAEIQAVNAIRSDLKDATGRVIGAPYGLGDPSQAAPFTGALSSGFLAMAFRTTTYDPTTFDVDRDFTTVMQVLDGVYGMSGSIEGIGNYLKQGKKLIVYHGWDDMLVQPYVSTRLYAALKKRVGPDLANARLYMFPGMGHCGGGVGASTADLVSGMVNWVEHGIAPDDSLVAAKLNSAGGVLLTRPLCEYPKTPRYVGGLPSDARSFSCVAPRDSE
jgi:feruloyl esterase